MRVALLDMRAAWRHVWHRPAVASLAIGMLAIGIGATTAMFSVADGVLLRALPYRDPTQLVTIWQTYPHWRGMPVLDAIWNRIALSYSEYRAVAAVHGDFEGLGAAYWRPDARLTGAGTPLNVTVARGSASLLPLLGLEPALGRWFLPGEEGAGAPEIAVLPHGLWVDRFAARPDVVGATIDLDGRPFVIVGVLPAEFPFGSLSPFARPADRDAIWTPIGSWSGDLTEHSQNYEVVGRLRPTVTVEHARVDAARVVRGDRNPAQHDAVVLPRRDAERGDFGTPVAAVLLAALVLLAITCGNLAALLFGEGAAREAEIQTRVALGASPRRIVSQLLGESALLALVGAAAGIGLASGLTHLLVTLVPVELPHVGAIAVNARVLVAALLTAGLAALAFGLAPALSLARLGKRVPGTTRPVTAARSRWQAALIVAQVALSVVLLVAAGLLTRTLAVELETPPGFQTASLLVVPVNASSHGGSTSAAGSVQGFFDAAIARVGALPGVERVTTTSNVPIAGTGGEWAISPNPAVPLSAASPSAQHDDVLPGYLEMLGFRLLAGRTLTDADRAWTPLVAVVNEAMARTFWPAEPAVGRVFLAPNGGVRTVVGVVADIHERGLGRPSVPTFFESVRQVPTSRQALVIRTQLDPVTLAQSVNHAIWSIDPTLPVGAASTMTAIVSASLAPERYRVGLVSFFALVAGAMVAIGIAGVAARTIAADRRDLCVRIAIGATPERIVRGVVGRYLTLALLGLAVGLAACVPAGRLVTAYLVGVRTTDPATLAAAGALVALLAALAAWLPSRRIYHLNLSRELARS